MLLKRSEAEDEEKHNDAEEGDENILMYRAPRNETYSLADFVKENYTTPVIVKRTKSIVSLSDEDCSSIDSDDAIESSVQRLKDLTGDGLIVFEEDESYDEILQNEEVN